MYNKTLVSLFLMVLLTLSITSTYKAVKFVNAQNNSTNISNNNLSNTVGDNTLQTNRVLVPNQMVVKFDNPSDIGSSATAAETIADNIDSQLNPLNINASVKDVTHTSKTTTATIELNISDPTKAAATVAGEKGANKLNQTQQATVAPVKSSQNACNDLTDTFNNIVCGPKYLYTLSPMEPKNSTGPEPRQDAYPIISQPQSSTQTNNQSSTQTNNQSSTQSISTEIDRVDADKSPARSGDGQGSVQSVVAVVDSGVDCDHPDLNCDKQWQRSFISGNTPDNIPARSVKDFCGHGTHVAGIIGAKDNNFGVVGVAPGAKILNIKVLELLPGNNPSHRCGGTNVDISRALDWISEHANSLNIDAANMSLGGKCEINDISCNDPIYESAIDGVVSSGVNVVVAAGNDHADASDYIPARFNQAITVSAIADSDGKCGGQGHPIGYKDDSLATFSNYGSVVDIAAPGKDINSTSNTGGYVVFSGTSMAAPVVTGAVALVKDLDRGNGITPSDVLTVLKNLGTTFKDKCDGNGKGYFTNDVDDSPEPLLYLGNMTMNMPSNSNITNTVLNTR